jgi:DNA-binding MltR family transcriptional regulator
MASRNRGRAKPKLCHLSRSSPSEEDITLWRKGFYQLHPIATAIWGAAMVDHELESLIRSRLARTDDDTWNDLVDTGGALSTFSAKITLGYALGYYDESIRHNLDIVRNIRNVFAHAKRSVDFSHELIVAELKRIKTPTKSGFKRDLTAIGKLTDGPQMSFAELCLIINSQLMAIQIRALKAKKKRLQMRLENRKRGWGTWGEFIARSRPDAIKSNRLLLPPDQNGGPNPLAQEGLLPGMFRDPPNLNKGKK